MDIWDWKNVGKESRRSREEPQLECQAKQTDHASRVDQHDDRIYARKSQSTQSLRSSIDEWPDLRMVLVPIWEKRGVFPHQLQFVGICHRSDSTLPAKSCVLTGQLAMRLMCLPRKGRVLIEAFSCGESSLMRISARRQARKPEHSSRHRQGAISHRCLID